MMSRHLLVPTEMKRRAASARCNSLPAGTTSRPEVQPEDLILGFSMSLYWSGNLVWFIIFIVVRYMFVL